MNQRDLELLSAYLDGELNPSDSTRLEARLKTNPELVSVLDDLRAARTLLRKLPNRRAPRNFTLTRKMVGLNPPLPRSYPVFRFATVLATLLFFFTFGINALATQVMQAQPLGFGGGGGGPGESELFSAAPAATEAPALAESSALAPEAPATEAPIESAELAPQSTMAPTDSESARVQETPAAKEGEEGTALDQNQFPVDNEAQAPAPIIPTVWLILFAVVAAVGTLLLVLMRRSSINRWK